MSFFNDAQRDGLLTGRYICSECGGLMEFEDEWEDTLVCPACGHSVDLEHYGNDETPLLIKEIPIDTMILTLNPEDTKHLPFGKYVYDIELTKATGEVDTFITKAILKLTEEVH